MSPRLRALLISGSPRAKGNTVSALAIAGSALSASGYSTELVRLRDHEFSPCIGCERCRADRECTGLTDGMTPLYEKLMAADLWVIASPVHNYNVTAWVKALIDRLYCFYDFDDSTHPRSWTSRLAGTGKHSIVIAVAEQLSEEDTGFALEAMSRPLAALGVPPLAAILLRGYFGTAALRRDGERCEQLGAEIVAALTGV